MGYYCTQNSPAKLCLFPERALPFHNNPPVSLQYSPATPILNENPDLCPEINVIRCMLNIG